MKYRPLEAAGASGSVGGVVYSHNRFGTYQRQRAIPTDPASSFQVAVRNIFSSLASRWVNVLTAAERAAWDTYAANTPVVDKIGQSIYLTGLNMYIRSNAPSINDASLSIIDTAPTVFTLGDLTAPVLSQGLGNVSIAYDNSDAWAVTTGGALFIYSSRPQNPSINFFKGPYRFSTAVLGDTSTPPTSPEAISWSALPFSIGVGQKAFFKINALDSTGRLSASWRGSWLRTS